MSREKTIIEKIEKVFKQNGQKAPIIIALIIYLTLLTYTFMLSFRSQEYVSFYLLDSEKSVRNIPKILVIGENNTFQLWVVVENHMAKNLSCMVLLKITDMEIESIPVQREPNVSCEKKVISGETWEIPMNITIDKPGKFSCIFELWTYDEKTKVYEFSKKFCVITLEVRELRS